MTVLCQIRRDDFVPRLVDVSAFRKGCFRGRLRAACCSCGTPPRQRAGIVSTAWSTKSIALALETIYAVPTSEVAELALEELVGRRDRRFPSIGRSWQENWPRVIPFFACPPEIRKVIHMTKAIASISSSQRRVTHEGGAFPNPDSVRKVLHLAVQMAAEHRARPVCDPMPRCTNSRRCSKVGRRTGDEGVSCTEELTVPAPRNGREVQAATRPRSQCGRGQTIGHKLLTSPGATPVPTPQEHN